MNLGKWGSPSIYEVENKWTKNETNETKINIEHTTWSNWNVIVLYNIPKLNQFHIYIVVEDSNIITSIKEQKHRTQVSNKERVEKNLTPLYPNFRPKNPHIIELINGKTIINKYILEKIENG